MHNGDSIHFPTLSWLSEHSSIKNISMASTSFNSMVVLTLQPITKKLTRSNFLVWKVLVTSALKGAQLSKFLYSKMEVPVQTILGDDKKMEVQNP
jgi:hypothetical protein